MKSKSPRQPAPAATTAPDRAPILVARGVRKAYRMGETGVPVLQSVDLSVAAGEFIAIEGRSGSGKSTLLHILAGLDMPDGGTIKFVDSDLTRRGPGLLARVWRWCKATFSRVFIPAFGLAFFTALIYFTLRAFRDDVRENLQGVLSGLALVFGVVSLFLAAVAALALSVAGSLFLISAGLLIPGYFEDRYFARLRNQQYGFVFQFYHLLPELNVLQNTLLPAMVDYSWFGYLMKRRQLKARAEQVLKQLGMSHRLRHRPSQLSGGERQRVAIARALMNSPRVLFADEPTGNLDVETGGQIMGVLEQLHREQGQTIVMVTHDRALARQADRVLVLRNGRLERASDSPSKAATTPVALDYAGPA